MYSPYQRDGPGRIDGNYGGDPDYVQSSLQPLRVSTRHAVPTHEQWNGQVVQHSTEVTDKDFEQPRALWKIICGEKDGQKQFLDNIVPTLLGIKHDLLVRALGKFRVFACFLLKDVFVSVQIDGPGDWDWELGLTRQQTCSSGLIPRSNAFWKPKCKDGPQRRVVPAPINTTRSSSSGVKYGVSLPVYVENMVNTRCQTFTTSALCSMCRTVLEDSREARSTKILTSFSVLWDVILWLFKIPI